MGAIIFLRSLSSMVFSVFCEFSTFVDRPFGAVPGVGSLADAVDKINQFTNPFYDIILNFFGVTSFSDLTLLSALFGSFGGLIVFRLLKWILDIIL